MKTKTISSNVKQVSIYRIMVGKLIKKECIKWDLDVAAAKKLYEHIPNIDFWVQYVPSIQFNAMYQLLTDKSKYFFKMQYQEYKRLKQLSKLDIPEIKVHNIGSEKLGEDKHFESKPKSIFDFIKQGEADNTDLNNTT